ncbi:single-stranded-DNA-specific exonuclease RecJ [Anaerocolumna xylanovorans]|uniref:Single-stranded-DNA-specific exonuclease RecJ n=1 Tax=Anaerocolumna xylanovorans DSM 12503 TaxID=1121345 RepID=A0A1M7YDJ0_9FIRM|nr:single-stranded-DNA-specific exonuclease RecJ [Anaerocolumna xylanovorans]SHO50673.1 single-stranded-DNA-specific exonuclease [Anaerocolumna xylanovorans DSM 12503]
MEKWVLRNKKADFEAIMKRYGISECLARLIVNRGLTEESDIDLYLNPDYNRMYNPDSMKDLVKACAILEDKINHSLPIRIVGDYDVDGVASTYILYKALVLCGARVDYEIPDRIKDGYGINEQIIDAAYEAGIDTILTCDNGIAALEQVKKAKKLGMTVIVTDHHDIPFVIEGEKRYLLPEADAIVNPKQEDCPYPFKQLCGAAVAYKLIETLFKRRRIGEEELIPLREAVAIATVCDVMELTGENRILVKKGLELLRKTENLGLRALMEKNQIVMENLAAYHLGFIIGPCLNAGGRLDTAKKGLRLLLAENKEEADRQASELKSLNDLRKQMTEEGIIEAVSMIEGSSLKEDKVLVVYLQDCHESLAGIIAGRLREKYNKPAIVLTKAHDMVKGSGRSIEKYNMYEELTRSSKYLTKFGGHPMAAGMSLALESVESFRISLNSNTTLTEEDLIPKVTIDVVLPLGYVSEALVEELNLLEPFGKGNEKPLFADRSLKILKMAVLGKNRNVLKFLVRNQYGKEMDAMYFGDVNTFLSSLEETYGRGEVDKAFQNRTNSMQLSLAYYPSVNEYNGSRNLQIVIQHYKPENL